MKASKESHRKKVRALVAAPVLWKPSDQESYLPARLIDVSETGLGIGFEKPLSLKTGSEIEIKWATVLGQSEFCVNLKCEWVDGATGTAGFCFSKKFSSDEALRQVILALVRFHRN